MSINRLFFYSLNLLFLLLFFTTTGWASDVCYQCHDKADFSAKIIHEPVANNACFDCHNPHVAKFEGLLHKSLSDLCFSCHSFENSTTTTDKLVIHEPIRLGKCLSCHDPHVSDINALIKEKTPGESCFGCHTTLQKDYTFTHQPFADGECTSCHKPHQADNYLLLNDVPEKLCGTCHSQDDLTTSHNFNMEVKKCLTCHNPHGSNKGKLIRNVLHAPYEESCDNCHQGNEEVKTAKCIECHEDVEKEFMTAHNHLTNKAGNSCVTCHSPHASDTKNLLRGKQTYVCRRCHEDTFARYRGKLYSHPDTGSCSDCHSIHGSNNLVMLKGDGNTVCSRCHESQGKFTHPVGAGINDPRNGQQLSCVSCHYPHGTDFQFNLKLSGAKELCIQCHRSY